MKKVIMLIVSLMILMSCSDESNELSFDADVYLLNTIGDVGTLSALDGGVIYNDILSVGKWSNDIIEEDGILYVVNSGNNNIQMINVEFNHNIGSIECSSYSNPMRVTINNGKAYVTNSYGSGIDLYSFENGELSTLPITNVPAESTNGGTDAIVSYNNLVFVAVKNIKYDEYWNAIYGLEYIVVINSETDELITAIEVGYNISDMLIDGENELHVLCTGNRDDINGKVMVYDIRTNNPQKIDEVSLGSEPGSFSMNQYGMVYVAVSGFNSDWTGFGGIMKYNSVTNGVLNNFSNMILESNASGILGLCIDSENRVYIPLFNENKLIILKNDVIERTLTTGNGPQGLVFVGE